MILEDVDLGYDSRGRLIGVGLPDRLTCWPTVQFSRPIHQEQKFLTHPPGPSHVRTETPSTCMNIIFATSHKYVTAATLVITK